MLKEFKDFIMRGNVVDLAVAVVIGAAFGNIVQSMVNDLIMPIVGALTGGVDFTNYFTALSHKVTATSLAEAKKQGAVLAWGNFLQMTVNFLIIAAVLFLVVKAMNTLKARSAKPAEAAAPPPKATISCFWNRSAICSPRAQRRKTRGLGVSLRSSSLRAAGEATQES